MARPKTFARLLLAALLLVATATPAFALYDEGTQLPGTYMGFCYNPDLMAEGITPYILEGIDNETALTSLPRYQIPISAITNDGGFYDVLLPAEDLRSGPYVFVMPEGMEPAEKVWIGADPAFLYYDVLLVETSEDETITTESVLIPQVDVESNPSAYPTLADLDAPGLPNDPMFYEWWHAFLFENTEFEGLRGDLRGDPGVSALCIFPQTSPTTTTTSTSTSTSTTPLPTPPTTDPCDAPDNCVPRTGGLDQTMVGYLVAALLAFSTAGVALVRRVES